MTKRERSTRRRQRMKAKVLCAIDFETRCPMEFAHHVGDSHIGYDQVKTYAVLAGLDEYAVITIHGGDLMQHVKDDK